MLKTILFMFLKALGVIFLLVALVTIAGAVLNSSRTREFRDNLKKK